MKTRPLAFAAAVLFAALALPAHADPSADARVAAARAKVDTELNARLHQKAVATQRAKSPSERRFEEIRQRIAYEFKAFDNLKQFKGSYSTSDDRIADALESIARSQRDRAQGYGAPWSDIGNGAYGGRR